MENASEFMRVLCGVALWAAFFKSLGRAPHVESLLPRIAPSFRERSDLGLWVRFSDVVLGIEQTLRSGWVPSEAQWAALTVTSAPLTPLPLGLAQCRDALLHLRTRGVALLPALARTRELALFVVEGSRSARSRGAPVLLQSWLMVIALPGIAFAFTHLLPELSEQATLWAVGCLLFWLWTIAGSVWMRRLVHRAARGGMRPSESEFGMGSLLGLESFRTSLESGHPPDIAWGELRLALQTIAPELAQSVPVALFAAGQSTPSVSGKLSAQAQQLRDHLRSFHQGIYLSVMEGRPCVERASASARLMRDELHAQRDAAFGRLSSQLIVPLLLCGALPWLALLALALGLAGSEILGGVALER